MTKSYSLFTFVSSLVRLEQKQLHRQSYSHKTGFLFSTLKSASAAKQHILLMINTPTTTPARAVERAECLECVRHRCAVHYLLRESAALFFLFTDLAEKSKPSRTFYCYQQTSAKVSSNNTGKGHVYLRVHKLLHVCMTLSDDGLEISCNARTI